MQATMQDMLGPGVPPHWIHGHWTCWSC